MLPLAALQFAADQRGGKLGRRPDGSFVAQPPIHTVGQKRSPASDRCLPAHQRRALNSHLTLTNAARIL
jgi:hypothetical protein